MASVITTAFENWKAQEAASGKAVLLDEFVFANVPNLDPTKPIDRNEKLPPANQIVHRQAVNKAGLASENAVAYSVTMGADVGNFDFNWIGLLNKASGTVAMITHAPTQKKLKTQNGQQGNVLTRSFILEFQGAAEETQIKTSAETWQIDFTARLSGIDEMQRLINVDSYGAAAFFNESFEVTRSGEQFTVKKGLGYVGGLRGELTQNQILNGLRNTKVYADFSYQGNIVSQWNTVIKITSAATLNNYVDAAGFTHQVFAIASIDASGNVKDLRPMGALSSQEITALENRLKLDLSKKIDKANITDQTGNSGELVASQRMVTTELGKKQPAGNYAPAGDYATNTSLSNGLDKKFDKTGGVISGEFTLSKDAINSTKGRHELPYKRGQLMQLGDYGWGGYLDNNLLATEKDVSSFLRNKQTPTQVYRNKGTTKYSVSYAANAMFKCGDTWANISVAFTDGVMTIAAGNETDEKISTVYSTANVKKDHNGNLKEIGDNGLSDYPVGSPIPWTQTSAPEGFLICNGQSFNKITYPLLAMAYPLGRLPDLRGEFIRGFDAGRSVDIGRTVLSAQGDAIRNITGEFSADALTDQARVADISGAFYLTNKTYKTAQMHASTTTGGLGIDISRTVPTADENRPRNIAFLYIVRAA